MADPFIGYPTDKSTEMTSQVPSGGTCSGDVGATLRNPSKGFTQTQTSVRVPGVNGALPTWAVTFTNVPEGACTIKAYLLGGGGSPDSVSFTVRNPTSPGEDYLTIEFPKENDPNGVRGPTIKARGLASGSVSGQIANWDLQEMYAGAYVPLGSDHWSLVFNDVKPGKCKLVVTRDGSAVWKDRDFIVTGGSD